MNNIIELKNISKSYNTLNGQIDAIKDISLDVKEGSFTSIVGSSGCGKSTLLNIIAGLEKTDTGKIIKKDNLKIGYMFQDDALLPYLTVWENAKLGLKLQGENNDKYVVKLLENYGLKSFKDKYPNELSGGMRQRVALIRTLATKPDLLLLDEPFSALDYQTRLKISEEVYQIIKKEKKTVIMITHDISEALSLSSEIYVFSPRPASIKSKYTIDLPNNMSSLERRNHPLFSTYFEKIWSDLDG